MMTASPAAAASEVNSAVVDDMKISAADEGAAWAAVAATLAKPHLQRSETEVSRCMTMMKRLRAIASLEANEGCMPRFTARLQLVKTARHLKVAPGVVLLRKKGGEGDAETVIPLAEPSSVGGADRVTAMLEMAAENMMMTPHPPPAPPATASSTSGGSMGFSLPSIHRNRGVGPVASSSGHVQHVGGGGAVAATDSALHFNRTGGSAVLSCAVSMTGATEFYGGDVVHHVPPSSSAGAGVALPPAQSPHAGLSRSRQTSDMFYLVVKGEVALERPTVNGRVRTEVSPGDAIGNTLAMDALPPGSFYLTLSETHLLAFPWASYEKFLPNFDENEILNRTAYLRERVVVPVFSPFAEARFRWFARCCYSIQLQSKEIAVREGDLSDCVFFILSGKMKVIREIDFSPAGGELGGGGGGGTCSPFLPPTSNGLASSSPAHLKLLDLATFSVIVSNPNLRQ